MKYILAREAPVTKNIHSEVGFREFKKKSDRGLIWGLPRLPPFSFKIPKMYNIATFPLPKDGYWKAFFIEFEFIGPYGRKLILTTETMVIPEELPWMGCWPDQRRQKLYNCTTQYERRFLWHKWFVTIRVLHNTNVTLFISIYTDQKFNIVHSKY